MTQKPELSLNFAAATDIGCKRSNNEDAFGYDVGQHIYVVCDGMGGSAAGEVASGMAVRALIERFESLIWETSDDGRRYSTEERLLRSIYEANRAVREAASGDPELESMGTTLVCACLDGSRMVLGTVGDSRAYLLRNGICQQITLDHSLLDEQVRCGMLTAEEAAASSLKSVITRAVGITETVEPDLFAVDLNVNDMLLLTTDGLTRYARPGDIMQIALNGGDLATICHDLIEHAKRGGGVDNITCVMLCVVEVAPSAMPEDTELPTAAVDANAIDSPTTEL